MIIKKGKKWYPRPPSLVLTGGGIPPGTNSYVSGTNSGTEDFNHKCPPTSIIGATHIINQYVLFFKYVTNYIFWNYRW